MKENSFCRRIVLELAPRLFLAVARMLSATYRIREYDHRKDVDPGRLEEQYIALFWHYSLFAMFIRRRENRPYVAMVSGSKDGEFVARIVKLIGGETARGSRRKGGLAALKTMMKWLAGGYDAVVIADGSQGPPRVFQAGGVLLASRSKVPIVPFAVAADRFITFRSWDRTILPLPFARVVIHRGEPIRVPPDLKAGELEQYRIRIEERLNSLYEQAWETFGRRDHIQ